MKLKTLFLIAAALAAMRPASAETILNVRNYGAAGDGRTIDSPVINEIIKAAAQTQDGVVLFPAGTYNCYSLHLQSNVKIRLEEGAVIRAAHPTEVAGFDAAEENPSTYQDFGHSHWCNSLIWGIGLQNITIEGKGLIDGTDVLQRDGSMQSHRQANKAIALKECQNVTFKDITLSQCGHFAMLLTGVDHLVIENVTVDTNRDGLDIDCCSDVLVSGCHVNSHHDDAIVLKSSYGLGYLKPTENVVIKNCFVSGYDPGTYLNGTFGTSQDFAPDRDGPTGRIKLGTESNGGFYNITIKDCKFQHCRGLALESVDGGRMENIFVSGIEMNDICNSPIYIMVGTRKRGPEGTPNSTARNIQISDVKVTDADCRYSSMISGVEGYPIQDVKIENVSIVYRGGITLKDVETQEKANKFFLRMPGYPEPSAHGIQPAWGFCIYNAENVTFKNVSMVLMQRDERPIMHTENVHKVKTRRVRSSILK